MDQPQETEWITSSFTNDPDMAELVEMFVDELPSRIDALIAALDDEDWEVVKRISHQLKGAAPGYGFDTVGKAAGDIERLLIDHAPVSEADHAARSFVELCKRVSKC